MPRLEKVVGIDVSEVAHLPVAKQRVFSCNVEIVIFSRYVLFSQYFGKSRVTR